MFMKTEGVDTELAKLAQNFRFTEISILKEAKSYFETTLHSLGKYELELKVIVDANIVIQEGLSYVKNGKSSLMSISKSPFFKILAPTWLLKELSEKIPIVAKERKIDEQTLRTAIDEIIKLINIVEVKNEEAYALAKSILGDRDPESKDVPYVALYLSVKSHGILTADKDILEQKQIKTFGKVGYAGKIVSKLERGTLSFLVVGEAMPLALIALYEITTAILTEIWKALKTLGEAFISVAALGVAALSELPNWVVVAIGVAMLIVVFWEEAREWAVKNILEPICKTVVNVLKGLYETIKSVISILMSGAELAEPVFASLFYNIEAAITYYEGGEFGDIVAA